jgi:hypothetical protein
MGVIHSEFHLDLSECRGLEVLSSCHQINLEPGFSHPLDYVTSLAIFSCRPTYFKQVKKEQLGYRGVAALLRAST